jgi:hypothetical protein
MEYNANNEERGIFLDLSKFDKKSIFSIIGTGYKD